MEAIPNPVAVKSSTAVTLTTPLATFLVLS